MERNSIITKGESRKWDKGNSKEVLFEVAFPQELWVDLPKDHKRHYKGKRKEGGWKLQLKV